MAWSAVSWAYRDVITSAKLAQMVENVRVHDHMTTDQGQRLGVIGTGTANGTLTTTQTTSGVYFCTTATVTIPSGLTAGRTLVVVAGARLQTSLATSEPQAGIYRDSTLHNSVMSVATPTTTRGYAILEMWAGPPPAAGSYTYGLSINAAAAATITISTPTLFVALL